ncbi:MAG TPA: SCP2 sterol-binding domain-containing protein [Stellaceae bacterium]|nr:SCP2 sterol-binding domain-containing protein [Stellaceae bacterium]
MSLASLTDTLRQRILLAPSLGHTAMFDLGGDGVIFWDGRLAPPRVDNEKRDAESTIHINLADLEQMVQGKLSPTMAYMTGKLKVDGALGVAMKLSQLIEE